MSFDALTLCAVRDELAPLVSGARIQRLVFVDELSLTLEAFAPGVGRTYVLLSADQVRGRVQRISQLPARGLERDSPFSLLIRKHLRNARVRSVHQPRLERVFELDCEQRDASGRIYRVMLIVEAMGRRSNLVLVDEDGAILDAARRTPPSRNPRRAILPHLRYAPPPAQDRLLPEQITAEALSFGTAGTLAKVLGERVAGLSPVAARELAYRATGSVDTLVSDADWQRVADAVREFVEMREWAPTVALDGDRAIDYAPYALTHLAATGAQLQRFGSISDAMELFYSQSTADVKAPRGDPHSAERKVLIAALDRAGNTARRRIAALEYQLTSSESERDPLRHAGEAILIHQAELPEGASQLAADGETIELDPTLSAVENAQAYFARYRKAREALERVPGLLAEARHTAEYLDELRAMVEVADQMDAIRALRREVATATGTGSLERSAKRQAKQPSKSTPYRRVTLPDGWEALIGTSAEGNAAVTFDLATPDDLWLHARGIPGAHVILRTHGATPPDAVLERAAQLAAHRSGAHAASSVDVDIAPRRYVKKIAGGPPGLVRYTNERTVRVTPTAS